MRNLLFWPIFLTAIQLLVTHSTAESETLDSNAERIRHVNQGTVGIISSNRGSTWPVLADDLAALLDDDQAYSLRVLTTFGKGSIRNIEDLLYLKGIDMAFCQADVLDFMRQNEIQPGLDKRLRYILAVGAEDLHVLTRKSLTAVDELAGRRVNFGPASTGSFMTASVVFDALDIDVEVATLRPSDALAALRKGEIEAIAFTDLQPMPVFQEVGENENLHFLAVPSARVGGRSYVPSQLTHESYPNLVPTDAPVQTIAVNLVLAAYNWRKDHPRYAKVKRFAEALNANFDRLRQPPFHPIWQRSDLETKVPGWQRFD